MDKKQVYFERLILTKNEKLKKYQLKKLKMLNLYIKMDKKN